MLLRSPVWQASLLREARMLWHEIAWLAPLVIDADPHDVAAEGVDAVRDG